MIIEPYISPCTNLRSMILRLDILNLIEEKVGNRLELVGTRKDFLNKTPVAQILRPN